VPVAADLLLLIEINGIHIDQDLILPKVVGGDGNGDKHPLGLMEGASENAAVCQAPATTGLAQILSQRRATETALDDEDRARQPRLQHEATDLPGTASGRLTTRAPPRSPTRAFRPGLAAVSTAPDPPVAFIRPPAHPTVPASRLIEPSRSSPPPSSCCR
jgi:hypothetical protein